MNVIDISGWSEGLEWNAIAENEDGVIIKILEGRTIDSTCMDHFYSVQEKGM